MNKGRFIEMLEASRHKSTFYVSLCVSFTCFFFLPMTVYVQSDCPPLLNLVNAGLLFIVFALASSVILFVLLTPLASSRIGATIISTVFAFGVLVYFQSSVIDFPYGPLDGSPIEWDQFWHHGLIDSALWLGGTFLAVLFRKVVYRRIGLLAVIFGLYQFILLASLWTTAPATKHSVYRTTDTTKYSFSNNQNVLLIVLDGLQSDIFQEIIEQNAQFKELLHDFIYFPDAIGGFRTTAPSVPLILTGRLYDNSIPFQTFVDDSLIQNSMPIVLLKKGFRVEAYDPEIRINVQAFSNLEQNKWFEFPGSNVLKTFFVAALVKMVPYYLKPRVLQDYYDNYFPSSARQDIKFVKDFENKAQVDTEVKVFKYYHLKGNHPPYVLDENCMISGKLGQDLSGYREQAKGCLKLAGRILNKLKQIGAYDNSMIFMFADHGAGFTNMGGAWPLMLWKPVGHRSDFKISTKPVSLEDISATVLNHVQVRNSSNGRCLCDADQLTERIRTFRAYTWEHHYWWSQYLPNMTEYLISGPARDLCSWKPSFKIYEAGKVVSNKPDLLRIGDEIVFGADGNYNKYIGLGWADPEVSHVWNNGISANIFLPLEGSGKDHAIVVECSPFTGPSAPAAQNVVVKVNCKTVGQWIVGEPGQYISDIPLSLARGDFFQITFEFPDAVESIDSLVKNEERKLAVSFRSLKIIESANDEEIAEGVDVVWDKGFFDLEKQAPHYWRWGDKKCELQVVNPTKKTKVLAVEMMLRTGYPEPSQLQISSAFWNEALEVRRADTHVRRTLHIPPGMHPVNFETNARQVEAPGDPRSLFFSIHDFKLTEVELSKSSDAVPKNDKVGSSQSIAARIVKDYTIGEQLEFDKDAVNEYLGTGWSFREDWGRWTDGSVAQLVFGLSSFSPGGVYCLEITGHLFRPDSQEAVLLLNGSRIGIMSATGQKTESQVFEFQGNLLKEKNTLTFQISNPVAPKDLELSEDLRLLGLGVRKVHLMDTRKPPMKGHLNNLW
jgi:hypothetical protein